MLGSLVVGRSALGTAVAPAVSTVRPVIGSLLIGSYLVGGLTPAPAAPPPVANEAGYALVYKVGQSFVWVQYGDTVTGPGDNASYALVYKVGQSFVWVQYGDTPAGVSSWQADGSSTCVFQASDVYADIWWRSDGDSVATWYLDQVSLTGFGADGTSTCEFYGDSGTPVNGGFLAQGKSTCTFRGDSARISNGFRADGKSTCVFMGSFGSGEGCLTPDEPGVAIPAIPNFVY